MVKKITMTLASARASSAITRPSMASPGTKVASLRTHSDANSQAVLAGTPESSAIGTGTTAAMSMMPAEDRMYLRSAPACCRSLTTSSPT